MSRIPRLAKGLIPLVILASGLCYPVRKDAVVLANPTIKSSTVLG